MSSGEILEVIESIFSQPGEFQKLSADSFQLRVNETVALVVYHPGAESEQLFIKAVCHEWSNAVADRINSQILNELRRRSDVHDQDETCSQYLYDLLLWCIDLILTKSVADAAESSKSESIGDGIDLVLWILKLDHIRDKRRYESTLAKWAKELHVHGRLFLCSVGKTHIFLLIEGTNVAVKEFVKRLRTVCIDVDTNGRRCKERMIDVLHNEQRPCRHWTDFCVEEFVSRDTFMDKLVESRLSSIIDFIK